jgi:hypothetical protein
MRFLGAMTQVVILKLGKCVRDFAWIIVISWNILPFDAILSFGARSHMMLNVSSLGGVWGGAAWRSCVFIVGCTCTKQREHVLCYRETNPSHSNFRLVLSHIFLHKLYGICKVVLVYCLFCETNL